MRIWKVNRGVFFIILTVLFSSLFSSCAGASKTSDCIIEKVFAAIKAEDEEALKELFSENTVTADPDFDEKIHQLIEFIDGELVSYDDWGGGSENGGFNEDRTWRWKEISYNVVTTKETYCFAIKEYTIDSVDPDNLGINSLYVIKSADNPHYPEYAYWGDGDFMQGIYFNVIYEENS